MIGNSKTRRTALALLLVVAACSGDDKDADQGRSPDERRTGPTSADLPADINAAAYTEEIRTSFSQACAQQGGTEAYCECTIEAIANTLPLDQFASYEQVILSSGDAPLPEQIKDAMRECADA